MIAIINYEAGNLASVSNALKRLKSNFIITDKITELDTADGIIFPGVGHARPAMQSLKKNGLDIFLKQTSKPILGICLGMQLLFESSDEGGGTAGLGLLPGTLRKFDSAKEKVPHMGWNILKKTKNHPLLKNLDKKQYFYFVHSYYAEINDYTLGNCYYINDFSAVAGKNNVVGVQFHPEKSGEAGSLLLQNFLTMTMSKITV